MTLSRIVHRIALVGVLSTSPVSAHAGEDMSPGERSILSAALVVAVPSILLSHSVGGVLQTAGPRQDTRAGPLPPMRVEAVEQDDDGGREVRLQDPDVIEHRAVLRWPARDDDPTAGFIVGARVTFVPTPAGSGWTLHSEAGEALAFVPTETAAADNLSQAW